MHPAAHGAGYTLIDEARVDAPEAVHEIIVSHVQLRIAGYQ